MAAGLENFHPQAVLYAPHVRKMWGTRLYHVDENLYISSVRVLSTLHCKVQTMIQMFCIYSSNLLFIGRSHQSL